VAERESVWVRLRRWLPGGAPVPEVDAATLATKLTGDGPKPRLLDVRTAAEYRRSHIEGAIHAPIQDLPRRLPELGLQPGDEIVAVCLSAHRSIPAVRLLRERGHDRAVQLAGGMTSWWRGGFPTRTG